MEISIADAAYIAGLFDADGSVQYKQYMKKEARIKKHIPRGISEWKLA